MAAAIQQKVRGLGAGEAATRRRVKMPGTDSLKDVAQKVFHDVRLLALLCDLNPGLPSQQALSEGTIVTLPTREEAQRFAGQMGFSLGYDPAAASGTLAKRRWARMNATGEGRQHLDPTKLAQCWLAAGEEAFEVASRLRDACSPEALTRLLADAERHPELQEVARLVAQGQTRQALQNALRALKMLCDGTSSLEGRRRVLGGAAKEPEALRDLLLAFLVPAALCEELISSGARAEEQIARAEEAVKMLPVALHGAGAAAPDSLEDRLREAVSDGLPLVDDTRLEWLGIASSWASLEQHLRQLSTMFRQLLDQLPHAPVEKLRDVLESSDGRELPRPWPVVARIWQRVASQVEAGNVASWGLGLGGLTNVGMVQQAPMPSLRAGEMMAKAAHRASAATSEAGRRVRTAKRLVELMNEVRPCPVEAEPAAYARAMRKRHFDQMLFQVPSGSCESATLVAAFDELTRILTQVQSPRLRDAWVRMTPRARQNLRTFASRAVAPIRCQASELTAVAKALWLIVLALDPETGPKLDRTSGAEIYLASLQTEAASSFTFAAADFVAGKTEPGRR